jgi:hypothetical protein
MYAALPSSSSREEILADLSLKAPFTALVVGPSGSGKTELMRKILTDSASIKPEPSRIIWFYGVKTRAHPEIGEQVKRSRGIEIDFREGLESLDFDEFALQSPLLHTLFIIDDLYYEANKSEKIFNLWIKFSHHYLISCICTKQTLFDRNPFSKPIMLNTKYIVMFRSRSDLNQFRYLAMQVEPLGWRYVVEAYDRETKASQFKYLLIDLSGNCPSIMQFRTGIGSNPGHIYVKK